jgi:hypothetical protein
MKAEFKTGDTVQWQGYGKPILAKVVKTEYVQRHPSNDWEWKYTVHGINEPLISVTSGRCIVESKYYMQPA